MGSASGLAAKPRAVAGPRQVRIHPQAKLKRLGQQHFHVQIFKWVANVSRAVLAACVCTRPSAATH